VQALSPHAIEAAHQAAQSQKQASAALVRAVELELAQASYQAGLEARRYQEVDPHNRLVALELERRWEAALSRAAELERRLDSVRSDPAKLPTPNLSELLALAHDLPAVWNAPQADMQLKQRLVRLLIYEVLCDIDPERREAVLVLHWQGGRHSEFRMPLTKPGQHHRQASEEVAQLLSEQADTLPAAALAAALNQRGLRTGTGRPWTAQHVNSFLLRHRLGKYARPADVVKGVPVAEAARRLGVSPMTVRALIQRGLLPMTQRYRQSPCHIPEQALHSSEFQSALAAIKRDRRSLHAKAQKRTEPPHVNRNPGDA
jgi:hypothetical protein